MKRREVKIGYNFYFNRISKCLNIMDSIYIYSMKKSLYRDILFRFTDKKIN